MAEALWSSNVGVDFTDDEDRRLIGAIWTQPGVIDGLSVSPGTGRSVSVSAGRAVVPDGSGGAYLCYFDAATLNIAVSANAGATRIDGVFVTVNDPGNGQAVLTITAGNSAPATPYLRIATVTVATNATSFVTGNINNGVRVLAVDARYFPAEKVTIGPASSLPTYLATGYLYLAYD
jgi:hypothetical protein